jgi:hypothetical protein
MEEYFEASQVSVGVNVARQRQQRRQMRRYCFGCVQPVHYSIPVSGAKISVYPELGFIWVRYERERERENTDTVCWMYYWYKNGLASRSILQAPLPCGNIL